MSREGALWIGGVEEYMDEAFLMNAMKQSGEDNVISVKVMRNKNNGAGYGFINFPNDQMALTAMHRLNGKMIPNSRPPARYKLNHGSNRNLPGEKNHSIWVGDLSTEIDDLLLYKFFSARFQSVVSAKIILDENGGSKGFGFIRFGNETEQLAALTSMQGISGLGEKPIKVSIAVQKAKDPSAQGMQYPPSGGQYGGTLDMGGEYGANYNQYNHYWSNMAAWQQYQNYYQQYPDQGEVPVNPPLPSGPSQPDNQNHVGEDEPVSILEGPLDQPVEHSVSLDIHKLNSDVLRRGGDIWEEIENSGWWSRD